MIRGIGIDIADPARLKALWVRGGSRFLGRWFAPEELAACPGSLSGDPGAWLRLAALYAAREAAIKAIDASLYRDGASPASGGDGAASPAPGWEGPLRQRDIRVLEPFGPGQRLLVGGTSGEQARERGIDRFSLTLSFRTGKGMALVVAEG